MKRNIIFAATMLTAIVGQAIAQGIPANPDPGVVRAGEYVLDKSHAKVNWAVSHLGFSTYNGEFTDVDAQISLDPQAPARSKLVVTVQTASVETNDDALDAHLRNADFFNTSAHPTATFRSTKIEPTAPNRARVTGDFTLLGVTKPLVLDVTFNGAGVHPVSKAYTIGFSAEGTIRRSDFGMNFLVPAVGNEVRLNISGEFNPRAAK